MSKRGQIDLGRPLTDEEKDHLLSRAGGADLIAINERQFDGLSAEERAAQRAQAEDDDQEEFARLAAYQDDDEDGFSPEDIAVVAPMQLTDLRAWCKKKGLDQTGSKEDLQVRVLEKMEADRTAGK